MRAGAAPAAPLDGQDRDTGRSAGRSLGCTAEPPTSANTARKHRLQTSPAGLAARSSPRGTRPVMPRCSGRRFALLGRPSGRCSRRRRRFGGCPGRGTGPFPAPPVTPPTRIPVTCHSVTWHPVTWHPGALSRHPCRPARSRQPGPLPTPCSASRPRRGGKIPPDLSVGVGDGALVLCPPPVASGTGRAGAIRQVVSQRRSATTCLPP